MVSLPSITNPKLLPRFLDLREEDFKKFKDRMAVEVIRDDGAGKKRRKASPNSLTDRNPYAPQHDDDDAGKIMGSSESACSEKLDAGKNGRIVPPEVKSDWLPDEHGVCTANDFDKNCQYNLRPKPHQRT